MIMHYIGVIYMIAHKAFDHIATQSTACIKRETHNDYSIVYKY